MANTLNLSSGLVKLPQQVAALSAQAICCFAGCCHLQQVAGVAAQASCCSASCCLLQQVAGLAAQGNCCQAASCWPSCSSKLLSGCKLLAQLLKQAAVRMQVAGPAAQASSCQDASCWPSCSSKQLSGCKLLAQLLKQAAVRQVASCWFLAAPSNCCPAGCCPLFPASCSSAHMENILETCWFTGPGFGQPIIGWKLGQICSNGLPNAAYCPSLFSA